MPIGTPENIDYFKNAPSDATHYICVGGERTFYKQDTGYIHKFINGVWYPLSFVNDSYCIEECIKVTPNSRILASRSLKEEQDSVWEYLKGSEKDFIGAPEGTNIIADYKPPLFYKLEGETLEYYNSYSSWEDSIESFYFVGDKGYNTKLPILAVRRKVKKTEPINKVIKVDCAIKSTPTEDKTVQEFQNGQEVMWHKDKAFYVGESKEKGKSVIETITNQGIHGTTYTQVTVNTASLSPVENKQEIQHKDLKQLKELLDSEINNWFNKLS